MGRSSTLQVSDFEYVGRALKSICEELLKGTSDAGIASLPQQDVQAAELGGPKE